MSIYIDGRDCCQTGQFSQDVADGALTNVGFFCSLLAPSDAILFQEGVSVKLRLPHWFPLLIWWTPLCLIRQILTRRFRLYAYKQLVEILVLYNFKGTGPLCLICVFLTILKPRHTVPDVAPPKFPLFCSFVGQSFYCPRWQCKHPLVAEFQ